MSVEELKVSQVILRLDGKIYPCRRLKSWLYPALSTPGNEDFSCSNESSRRIFKLKDGELYVEACKDHARHFKNFKNWEEITE